MRAMGTREPCTCEYVNMLLWDIAQNFQPTFSMSVSMFLFRRSSKTAMFSRFLKVAITTLNFKNEVYNGENQPLQTSFLKFNVAISTFKNPLNVAVLDERLNKTDIEKFG